MLLFCPYCANCLTISTIPAPKVPGKEKEDTPINRLECLTCPYQYIIDQAIYERKTFEHKERDDVFGGPGAWDNADKMQVQCPKDGCDGALAAFFQVQIRSADEPMTSFFKCMACGNRWREN